MAARSNRSDSSQPLLVVGIGASAGGLSALKSLFAAIPRDTGMAFVVITHLHPDSESALSELIGREADIPVGAIEDGVAVAANHAYVLQPGYRAIMYDGALHLEPIEDRDHPPAPVNRFFRALGQDQRERAVGIVLSGTGTDGTIGVEEIKGNLGMTIASSPDEAEYPGMPQSAIDSGYVDHEVLIREMPELLVRYGERAGRSGGSDAVSDADRAQLNKILAVVRSQTGHDFSTYKTSTMFRRIRRRLNVQQIDSFEDYLQFIRRSPREAEALFHELLIGVTSFFRDPEAFEALKRDGLPKLLTAEDPKDLRVWVPGCSTGEEAYSIAILLQEYCVEHGIAPEISVFATDISEDAIARARRGVYPDSIGADVGAERLREHFDRQGDSYQVRKHIRNMLVFSEQNLTADPPFTRLDIVSCRNLLIYLDQDTQRRLIPLFHYSLRDAGLLFLGSSESIGGNQDLFTSVSGEHRIFRKRPDKHPRTAGLDFALRREETERRREMGVQERRQTLEEKMRRYLLEHHAPPAVFVTRKHEIVYVQGRTGKYLEPASGEARMNIMDMAREGLAVSLGTALRECFRTDAPVTRQGIRVRTNGDYVILDLEVRPFADQPGSSDLCVVLFHERPDQPPAPERAEATDGEPDKDEYVQHIEEELRSTRERLQTTVEELETTNEELKSSLEESQSTNEELQSSNEELESSKEEMQSLNEELSTVNAELQEKNEELNHANQEMKNFLDSLDIPIVFVDNELKIRQFTEAAKDLINMIDTDVTRHIGQITTRLRDGELVDEIEDVVRRARYKERQVETKDGKRFRMRLSPYRNVDNVMEGVLVAFIDIPDSD